MMWRSKRRASTPTRTAGDLLQAEASKYGHTLCLQPEEEKCRTMIFFENSYSADTRDQVEDRIYRRGQTGETVLYIDLSGSPLDRRVTKALQRKDRLYRNYSGTSKRRPRHDRADARRPRPHRDLPR